jgi:hypothetical protein
MIVVDGEGKAGEREEKLGLSVAGWGPSAALAARETKSVRWTTFCSSHTIIQTSD